MGAVAVVVVVEEEALVAVVVARAVSWALQKEETI